MRGPSPRGRRPLVALGAVLALCLGGASFALAGDPPGRPPPAVPAPGPDVPPVPAGMAGATSDAPAPPGAAGAPSTGPKTEDELFALVTKSPVAFGALILFKFVVAAGGLVVVILLLVRRGDVRRGHLAPPIPRPPAVAPFEILGALGMLGLWFVAGPLLSMAAAVVLGEPEGNPSLVTSLACMSIASLPIAAAIALVSRRRRAGHGPAALAMAPALRIAGGAFLVAGAVVLVLQYASALVLQHVFGRPPEMQDLVQRMVAPKAALEPWLITFLGVFVAPFAEEAVFRGTVYPAVRRYIGKGWAAVLVSAVFAAIHWNALALVPLFGLALLLTWCYERTGSIFASVVVHALSNAASLAPLLLLG